MQAMQSKKMKAAALRAGQAGSNEAALQVFRLKLLEEPALAMRLGAIEVPETFADAAKALAEAQGIALAREELERALRQSASGGGLAGNWVTLDRWPAPGWVPARSVPTCAAPDFDWLWLGAESQGLPFYDDGVRRARARPLNRLVRARTTLEHLAGDAAAAAATPPAGLIFHMSRCGSTLLAQMLGRLSDTFVISEPEPLDAVLQWASRTALPDAARAAALEAIVAALGRNRNQEQRLFLKLDAWHAPALPLLRQAFPNVPWLFLYRDPLLVMASHMRMPGSHAVHGVLAPEVLGIENGHAMGKEEYCAQALARILAAVIANWPLGGGLLVDHSELAGGLPARVAGHFGLLPNDKERALMSSAALSHSKTGAPFVDDRPAKRSEASPAMHEAAGRYLRPLVEALDGLRLGRLTADASARQ